MKPITKKIISFFLIAAGGIIVGLIASFYVMLQRSIPQVKGAVSLSGLTDSVEISYDSLGIAQIWAANEPDAYFTLGYQHAADRLFQMDLTRRIATGKLSELIGSAVLTLDQEQRQIGHLRMAIDAQARLSERNRRLLQAYTDGVNAYVTGAGALPFEYRFLPEKFAPWQMTDCLAILSFETWFSNALMNRDEFYQELAAKVGDARARSLIFPYPAWGPSTVIGDGALGAIPREFQPNMTGSGSDKVAGGLAPNMSGVQMQLASTILQNIYQTSSMCDASNAWVVAPSHSASGKAMLASDPHLELTRLPQFWYPVGMHAADSSVDVLGITAAGLPFFAMGHNGRSAWAFTAGGIDVLDYVTVELDPADTSRYLAEGQWLKFGYTVDSFNVAGVDSIVVVPQRYTVYGPLVAANRDSLTAIAVHWVGFDTDLSLCLQNAFGLANVKDFGEFRRLVTGLGAFDANMMYADIAGNIGYQLTAPLRPGNRATSLPVSPSEIDTIAWTAFAPLDETPNAFNPPSGWLANCNNLPSRNPAASGYFFATRILSITDLLSASDKINVDDMRTFQLSSVDRYLLRMKDEFVRISKLAATLDQTSLLENWDGSAGTDSRATALINVYLERLQQLTFEDELGPMWHQVPSKWIEDLHQVDSAGWFDDTNTTQTIESYDTIAVRAMRSAISSVGGRTWGELQSFRMQHPMSSIPLLGTFLDLETPVERWGGTPGSLNSSFYRTVGDDKFESIAGPSWRFVIDFADIDKATMVIPAGVSGNPMSPHFLDFYALWKSGQQWTVPFHRDPVIARSATVLTLKPASK